MEVVRSRGELTCTRAKKTSMPPIIPTSTQGKMLHIVVPKLDELFGKKSVMQADCALECRDADIASQAAPTANRAAATIPWSVRKRRNVIALS